MAESVTDQSIVNVVRDTLQEQHTNLVGTLLEVLHEHEHRLYSRWEEASAHEWKKAEGRRRQAPNVFQPIDGVEKVDTSSPDSPQRLHTLSLIPSIGSSPRATSSKLHLPGLPPSVLSRSTKAVVRCSDSAKELALDLTPHAEKKLRRSHQRSMKPAIHFDDDRPAEIVSFRSDSDSSPTGAHSGGGGMWWRGSKNPTAFMKDTMGNYGSYVLTKGWSQLMEPLSKSAKERQQQRKTGAQRFILSTTFDVISATVIILYAVMLAYHVEYMSRNKSKAMPTWMARSQISFTCYFFAEVCLRMWAAPHGFWLSKDRNWNIFDVFVVSIAIFEILLNFWMSGDGSNSFAVVRVLRILRIVRAIRLIRIFRFFTELRMMVHSSLKSLKPFCWAITLMLMLTFMFGLQVTQVFVEYRVDHPEKNLSSLESYFGSLDMSILTLFQSVSGGVSWRDAVMPLLEIHWSYAVAVAFFVSFVVFAVLNVVTGIFVNSAMHSAQADQDIVIQEEMMHEDSYANEVLRIFMEADRDHEGFLDLQKLEMHMKDHRVRAYLRHMGLDVDEATGLFRLLDIGNTGRVSDKDFLLGCMRLKGPAKNVDVATLLYENKRMVELWSTFMQYVEQQFERIMQAIETGMNNNIAVSDSYIETETCIAI